MPTGFAEVTAQLKEIGRDGIAGLLAQAQADLAAAHQQAHDSWSSQLTSANAQIAALQTQLTAAQAQVATLTAQLGQGH